jgi:pimeloyl-ACP methyl ester carboxylesterase
VLAWLLAVSIAFPLTALAAEEEEEGPPKPEDIELVTKDGVVLKATWYASRKKTEAVPVMLLHQYRGSRGDFRDLALYLQLEKEHAVIVPDLRGHGDSLQYERSDGSPGRFDVERLRPEDFDLMATEDVEAVKRFLMRKNNDRELNIEKLCLVGAEMGAMVGIRWAWGDWAWGSQRASTVKQGRDVKALTLISPEIRFKNLQASLLTTPPIAGQVAIQIVAGANDPKAVKNARQLHNLAKKLYVDKPQQQMLFLDVGYKTRLQGTKMLGEKLGLEERIANFIELRAVKQPFSWTERKGPLP